MLSRTCRDAVRWGRLVRNPAAAADPPAAAESRATAWTAKELGRFLEHVDGERLFALWRLAATTGMRRGELLGLTWLALDVDGGTLRVDQQLVPTRGGVTFGPPKSKRSRRTIALDAKDVRAWWRGEKPLPGQSPAAFAAQQPEDEIPMEYRAAVRAYRPSKEEQ